MSFPSSCHKFPSLFTSRHVLTYRLFIPLVDTPRFLAEAPRIPARVCRTAIAFTDFAFISLRPPFRPSRADYTSRGARLYFKGVPSSGIYVRYSPRRSNSETWSWPIGERRRQGCGRGNGRKRGGITTAFEMDAGAISDGALNRPSRTSMANIMLNLS